MSATSAGTDSDLGHPLLESLQVQFGSGVRQAVVFQRRDADAARHVMRSAGLGAGMLMRSLGKRRGGGLPNIGILALVDGELRAFSTKGGGAGMRAKELVCSWEPSDHGRGRERQR